MVATIAFDAGLNENSNGGYFENGKEYSTIKKAEVEREYWRLVGKAEDGKTPSKRVLAKAAKVSPNYTRKIIVEIQERRKIITVENLKLKRKDERKKGVGALSLTLEEQMFLLDLQNLDSTRTRSNYIHNLFMFCDKSVSHSFISEFFIKIGPFKGTFRKLPQTPIDKFKPQNIQTYSGYLNYISSIPPHLIHFGDEKLLKGMEVYNRKGRINPFTGKSDPVIVPPYFRNTFCVMGFITINTNKYPPLLYSIGEDNHEAFIVNAVACGWLSRGDFVVVDNAVLHSGGHADIAADFLWNAPGLDG